MCELAIQGHALVWCCCPFVFIAELRGSTRCRWQHVLCLQLYTEETGASCSNLNTQAVTVSVTFFLAEETLSTSHHNYWATKIADIPKALMCDDQEVIF